MLKVLRRLFSRAPAPLTFYRFPLIKPEGGNAGYVEGTGASYVEARLAAMSQVDTGRYLVGPGVAITVGGNTLQ